MLSEKIAKYARILREHGPTSNESFNFEQKYKNNSVISNRLKSQKKRFVNDAKYNKSELLPQQRR